MVKILFVSDTFYPRVDGIIRFMEEMYDKLRDKYDITLLVPKLDGGSKKANRKKMKVIYCPTFNFSIAEFRPSKPLTSIVKNAIENTDLIFVNTPGGPLGASSIYYAKKKNKKIISYAHTLDWELFPFAIDRPKLKKIVTPILKRIYSQSDLILVPDELIANEYRKIGITSEFKILPLGADVRKFKENIFDRFTVRRELGIDKEFVIGYHGRLSKEKNIKLLVDSFKKFHKKYPDSKLLVLGDGPERDLVKGDGIISTGFVSNPELYLRVMDCYVLLSKTETSALSLMEAISSGIPIISSAVGLIPTYVNDTTGILIEKKDLKKQRVVQSMESIRNSRFKAKIKTIAARIFIEKRDWNKIANELSNIFDKTLVKQT